MTPKPESETDPWLADAATGATGQTFEIRSVEDFFKVPEGRRRICLREFHVWMSMLDGMEELFGATRDALGIPAEACGVKGKRDVFVWYDDGLAEARAEMHVEESREPSR